MLKTPGFDANQSSLIIDIINFTNMVKDSALLHRLINFLMIHPLRDQDGSFCCEGLWKCQNQQLL